MKKIHSPMPYSSYYLTGEDHLSFLQGQLTQDINSIKDGQCQFGAFCSPKGSMLGNFLIYQIKNQLVLRIHQQQATPIINRLKLFILRSDVTISPTEHQHNVLNLAAATEMCQTAKVNLPKSFESIEINDNLLIALPNEYFEYVTPNAQKNTNKENINAANYLRLISGIVDITPDNNESIMPQQTPLEYWGGISYTKGCYVGQEIIARSRYRGQVRKTLATITLEKTPALQKLSSIKDAQGKPIAKIFDFQSDDNRTIIQIIVDKTLLGSTIDSEYGSITISEIQ